MLGLLRQGINRRYNTCTGDLIEFLLNLFLATKS